MDVWNVFVRAYVRACVFLFVCGRAFVCRQVGSGMWVGSEVRWVGTELRTTVVLPACLPACLAGWLAPVCPFVFVSWFVRVGVCMRLGKEQYISDYATMCYGYGHFFSP